MFVLIQVVKGKARENVDLSKEQLEFLERRRKLRKDKGNLEGRDDILRKSPASYDRSKGIFGAQPLGLFPVKIEANERDTEDSTTVRLETWDRCEERHLKLLSTTLPKNYLEEMVDWTEKGVMWQFPIDNEQGIDHDKVGGCKKGGVLSFRIGIHQRFNKIICVSVGALPRTCLP